MISHKFFFHFALYLLTQIVNCWFCCDFSEIDKKQKTLDSEHETFKDSLKLFKKKKEDLTDEKFELETEVEKGKSLVDQKNTEVSMILKEIEAAKNEQATLEGDR